MKNKPLTARILVCILSILVCSAGWVGAYLSLDSPDLTAVVGISEGIILVGLVANVIIWRWGDKKGE